MPRDDVTQTTDSRECQRLIDGLTSFGVVRALKLYRVGLTDPPPVPLLPCLDHEAMLHQVTPPHASAYVEERSTGDLHELAFMPARRRIEVDLVSTYGESEDAGRNRLLGMLASTYPGYTAVLRGPTWWRGDLRVARACRAQVTLRDVLTAADLGRLRESVDRLQIVSAMMEKESRVASWGVRTITGPMLAATGFLAFELIDTVGGSLSPATGVNLRLGAVGLLGLVFLYYGLKAVQLTGMANRAWKRAAEYKLILAERARLPQHAP
ncbi:MAG: hypothetical protein AB7G23_06130 [Vicinamibacterales bacterium]